MNATKNLLTNLCNLLVCACEAFRYGLTFLRAILYSRAVLAAGGHVETIFLATECLALAGVFWHRQIYSLPVAA